MSTTEGFSQNNTCVNHPERIAVENCEVCNNPLCAYCLYYTSDGQRLCKTHAEQAQAGGAFIRAPGTYAEGLIHSQIDASKRNVEGATPTPTYQGNSMDLVAFVGVVLGVISLASCFGASCLLLPLGFIVSLASLLSLRDAYDKSRTRRLAIIGMAVSGLGVLAIVGCIAVYVLGFSAMANNITPRVITTFQFATVQFGFPTDTPTPRPTRTPESSKNRSATPIPTVNPEITDTPDTNLFQPKE